jgi:hypothetical protein
MVIATGLLLVATLAGCGAKQVAKPKSTALSQQELAAKYGQCMRDNGIPDFPDPKVNANGGVSVDMPQDADPQKVTTAQEKCKQYALVGGEPQKLDPQRLDQLRKLAQCMRDQGVKNFPDPTDQGIQANGNDSGLNPEDPTFKAAMEKCSKYGPSEAPGDGPGTQGGSK